MKKTLFVLIALMSISTLSIAQKSRSSSSSSNSIRADRQFAITTNAGLRTMTGFGVVGSYYATPKIAADLGVGFNILRGPRFGVRGRYLFTENNFTPIIGAGINVQGGSLDWNGGTFEIPELDEMGDVIVDANGNPITQFVQTDISISSSVYGQLVTGFEWMADGGFVVGFTLGYRIALNDAVDGVFSVDGEPIAETDEIIDAVNDAFGSGLSFALNLGYAF